MNTLVAYAAYLGELVWPAEVGVLYPHPHGGLLLEEAAAARPWS